MTLEIPYWSGQSFSLITQTAGIITVEYLLVFWFVYTIYDLSAYKLWQWINGVCRSSSRFIGFLSYFYQIYSCRNIQWCEGKHLTLTFENWNTYVETYTAVLENWNSWIVCSPALHFYQNYIRLVGIFYLINRSSFNQIPAIFLAQSSKLWLPLINHVLCIRILFNLLGYKLKCQAWICKPGWTLNL